MPTHMNTHTQTHTPIRTKTEHLISLVKISKTMGRNINVNNKSSLCISSIKSNPFQAVVFPSGYFILERVLEDVFPSRVKPASSLLILNVSR